MESGKDLGIPEASRLVGASGTTLRRMIKSGELKARKKKHGGRLRWLIQQSDLLAAFGRVDSLPAGAGSVIKKRALSPRRGGSVTSQDDQERLVKILQDELSKREHEIAGLKEDLRRAREDYRSTVAKKDEQIEALHARIEGLLREGWSSKRNGGQQPQGILGFLESMIRR